MMQQLLHFPSQGTKWSELGAPMVILGDALKVLLCKTILFCIRKLLFILVTFLSYLK